MCGSQKGNHLGLNLGRPVKYLVTTASGALTASLGAEAEPDGMQEDHERSAAHKEKNLILGMTIKTAPRKSHGTRIRKDGGQPSSCSEGNQTSNYH